MINVIRVNIHFLIVSVYLLVNRVKPLMASIIHRYRCYSVPRRSSEGNASLLRDICDYMVVLEMMACAFISIDREKAFDSVYWGFLDKILETVNFGPEFRVIIK